MKIPEIKEELRKNGLEVVDYYHSLLSKELCEYWLNDKSVTSIWVLRRKSQSTTKEVKS